MSKSATGSFAPTPASIVSCRDRQWVVLPSENPDIIRLRPLSGNEDQICGIYQPLGLEAIAPAQFPLPQPETVQHHTAVQLLMDAARLSLQSGATLLISTAPTFSARPSAF